MEEEKKKTKKRKERERVGLLDSLNVLAGKEIGYEEVDVSSGKDVSCIIL